MRNTFSYSLFSASGSIRVYCIFFFFCVLCFRHAFLYRYSSIDVSSIKNKYIHHIHVTASHWMRQTTGCIELFLLVCYVYYCVCLTVSVTQNAVCNCEIKSIHTYLLG